MERDGRGNTTGFGDGRDVPGAFELEPGAAACKLSSMR